MIQNLYINKLTLLGFRKDYTIDFKEGLNIITGPISTGKSAILELINYSLGSKSHKEYQEIRSSCSDVNVELTIKGERILLSRPLFHFKRPIKLYKWSKNENRFSEKFDILEIDSPSNPKSLSFYLLDKLNVPEITLSGQQFSFRDLFSYSYVSQPKMDSENIQDESNPLKSFKRKPTLEIIFNSLNELLHGLREKRKQKKEDLDNYFERKKAIVDFLRSVDMFGSVTENNERFKALTERRAQIKIELDEIKNQNKRKDTRTRSLEARLFLITQEQKQLYTEQQELKKYKEKLQLLNNQYSNEIIKLDYLIIANGRLQKVEFVTCPSCSNELTEPEYGKCKLCGSDLKEFDEEEERAIKLERKRLNAKISNLLDFIEQQENQIQEIDKKIKANLVKVAKAEEKIHSIQRVYISPILERIEQLNRELGEIDGEISKLEKSQKVQDELNTITFEIGSEEQKLQDIIDKIKEIEKGSENIDGIIEVLSDSFNYILDKFSFPKLTDTYIDSKNYLPYVRNVKYSELGSGGAQTLISIAYHLAILKVAIQLKNTFHTGILMLDTVSKNLGTGSPGEDLITDEFKDVRIFKSMMTHLTSFSNENSKKCQLIVVNNVLPEETNVEDVIVRFDGDGTKGFPYGLIDDIQDPMLIQRENN